MKQVEERSSISSLGSSPSLARCNLSQLPQSYTDVPPFTLCKNNPLPPRVEGPCDVECQLIPEAMKREYNRYAITFNLYHFVNTKYYSINFFNMLCRWLGHVRLVTSKMLLQMMKICHGQHNHACCSEEEASSHRKSLSCLYHCFMKIPSR